MILLNPAPIHDKNSQKSKNGELSQLDSKNL